MIKSLPQLSNYGSDQENFGVLRVPDGTGPHPVVALIHGGMWLSIYDLDYFNPVACALVDAGIATWNIEYRRIGNGGGFETTFQDVARGIDHLRTLAPTYRLDLQRVVVMGHSAGGHLAIWVAARHRIPEDHPLFETAKNALMARAAISLAGILDLNAAEQQNLGNGAVLKLLGGSRDEYPMRYAATSPIEMLPLGVLQILIHGTQDESVPFEFSKNYHTAASACGDPVALVQLRGAGHFELVDPKTPEWQNVLEAVQSSIKGV